MAGCQSVTLALNDLLTSPQQRMQYVYFPTESFISQTVNADGRSGLEVGLIGDEGMLGLSLMLGVTSAPLRAVVQGAGLALRMETAAFCRELRAQPVLEGVLKRYTYVVMAQTAQTAACTHFHFIEARLARWLLMSRDRSHSNSFYVTHEFLSYMLGVRRAGVTRAATALQRRRLIHYRRGDLTILDGAGLEAAACECYARDNASYAQVMDAH